MVSMVVLIEASQPNGAVYRVALGWRIHSPSRGCSKEKGTPETGCPFLFRLFAAFDSF